MTFLFTDIEGSTRRWETDADLMRKALPAHDEVLRSTVEVHGGDQTYESLAHKGETMTAEMTTYAYDQIDQARAEPTGVSK